MAIVKVPATFDEYKVMFPPEIQKRLEQIRRIVKKEAPQAEEKISYGMPAFTLNGMLLYFAAHTRHIGFYPFTTAITAFSEELSSYHTAKGSIRFPHDRPLPLELISEIVKFRVQENLEKAELWMKKKKR